jgi:ribosome-associated heat shock protein Hsp15
MDSTRVDKWLWSIRLYPTRSAATAACNGGHVQINGRPAKPSSAVIVGDCVNAYSAEVHRVVVVAKLIDKRVGAKLAVDCYVDETPVPPPAERQTKSAVRDSGSGRPTKKDRRQLDHLRGRNR